MQLICITQPTIEPISLIELKGHLRIDSETFAGNMEDTQTIAPGSHATTVGYALIGSGVSVAGKQAIVYLEAGTNGATGTVDAKIQEYNGSTWADWTGGAFAQVTTANDNATYEKAYTGTASQIRVVAQVLLAACEFGVSVVTNSATTAEDDKLTRIIAAARLSIEKITCRRLLTQTWDYFPDCFPNKNYILIPFGNLQNVTSVAYTDTAGTVTTMTPVTDYIVETNGDQHGKLVLPYGESWPSTTLYPSKPIAIRFVCGWTAASSIPADLLAAVEFDAEKKYYHADRDQPLENAIDTLTADYRLWGEF